MKILQSCASSTLQGPHFFLTFHYVQRLLSPSHSIEWIYCVKRFGAGLWLSPVHLLPILVHLVPIPLARAVTASLRHCRDYGRTKPARLERHVVFFTQQRTGASFFRRPAPQQPVEGNGQPYTFTAVALKVA